MLVEGLIIIVMIGVCIGAAIKLFKE